MPHTIPAELVALRRRVDDVLAIHHSSILPIVRDSAAEALGKALTELPNDVPLLASLGASSLDFLDLIFRLERAYNLKLPRGGLRQALHSELGPQFEQGDGTLSEEALAMLRFLMPELGGSTQIARLRSSAIGDFFTVDSFVRLVAWGLADRDGNPVRRADESVSPSKSNEPLVRRG